MVIPRDRSFRFLSPESPLFIVNRGYQGNSEMLGVRAAVERAGLLGLTEGGSRGGREGQPEEGGKERRPLPPSLAVVASVYLAENSSASYTNRKSHLRRLADRPITQTACWWRSLHNCRLVAHLRENGKVPPNCPTPVPVCPSV